MDDPVLVCARGVSRLYGRRLAVDHVDLALRRGEILGFLGPNGAGKSTTMQILSGVLAPHGGTVEICGFDLHAHPIDAKRRIGYLPEIPPLYHDARVDEYLDFCARLRGVPRERAAATVARARDRCGLNDAGGRLIAHLSKGYQQRVGIAQAIVHEPEILILDEPTTGLDPNQRRDVRALIRQLGQAHAVILSTHVLSEVQAVCTRVSILHLGRIVFDEPVGSRDPYLRLTLGNPPACAALAAIDGVLGCELIAAGQFRLAVCDLPATAERVAVSAVYGGWALREIREIEPPLEQTFFQLTCGEPPHSVA